MSVFVFGDSASPDMRHHLPVALIDPAAYIEHDGGRYVLADPLEAPALRALGGLEVTPLDELGAEEALAAGKSYAAATAEAVARGCEQLGLRAASVPADLPLALANLLSSRGVELRVDAELFASRRRVKIPQELDGIRRAQRAAVAAMTAIRERIATGEEVEAEELRREAWHVLIDHGAVPAEALIIASGRPSAKPHEEGQGPIQPNQPIVVDIFPRDIASGCWGDLSRTFCLGKPPERLRRCHEDVLAALAATVEAIRPGVTGEELNRIAARCLQERGHPTKFDSPEGRTPAEGFAHCVGHGVGLQVHEEPVLDQGCGPIVAGDVLAIEPGVYYDDLGGVRIEDVVLVTEDGCESLTDCPYELEIG